MHNKNLDGLRGWAAIIVVIFHAILHYDPNNWLKFAIAPMSSFSTWNDWVTGLSLIFFNGDTAVVIFFVLSGLVLHESLKRSNEGPIKLTVNFTIKRILRIYPTVIACVLITYAMSEIWRHLGVTSKTFEADSVIKNMTLQGSGVLNVSWTLTIEVIAIAILIPTFFISKMFGTIGMFTVFSYSLITTDNPALVFGIQNMHVAMIAFVSGMTLSSTTAKIFFSKFGRLAWIPIMLLLIFGNHINSTWATSSIILRVFSAAMLIGTLRYSENFFLDSALSSKPSQFLGKISFSLYLFNVPVMYAVYAFTPMVPSTQAATYGIPLGILIVALAIPVATISYVIFERPSMALSKYITGKISRKQRTLLDVN